MYVKVQTVDSVHHNVGINSHYHMSFKVLTEVLLKIQVFGTLWCVKWERLLAF
jgi:hypothetical protein